MLATVGAARVTMSFGMGVWVILMNWALDAPAEFCIFDCPP